MATAFAPQPLLHRFPVTLVVDTPCWFDRLADELLAQLERSGAQALLTRDASQIQPGGIAFFLSCMNIVPAVILARSVLNVVVHASALPEGKGFSPQVWQVLEGRNEITVSMFEAVGAADAGPILAQDVMRFEGHELNSEMRATFGAMVQRMCWGLLSGYELPAGRPQIGEGSWYRRRYPKDSVLDPNKSIAEQFDLLRVVDNERYPAFFDHRGHRYVLKIEKAD